MRQELAAKREFGMMAAFNNNKVATVPLGDVAGKTKYVPADHPLINQARAVDTCFGDRKPDVKKS